MHCRLFTAALVAFLATAASCAADAAPEAPEDSAVATATEAAADSIPVEGATQSTPAAPTTLDTGPKSDLPPNELGKFLVLEYHRLGEPEGEFRRTAENFRKDLESLYAAGYRPVTMRQMVEGQIDIPAGTSPVVFTIDDSSQGQFYLLEDGSIDPGTMMGMWENFRQENPGWDNGAVWCILPGADHPSNFFGEKPSREVPRAEREAAIQRKMDLLVENDHEICNHTLYHARLDRARDDAQVQEFIGRGEDSIQVYLPDNYEIVTFSLPLGMWPANRQLAWRGEYQGRPYEYKVVLEVSGDENVSPFHRDFEPHSVNRFIVAPGRLERQLDAWERNPGERFISDGDPGTIAVPAGRAGEVAGDRYPGLSVREVAAEPGS